MTKIRIHSTIIAGYAARWIIRKAEAETMLSCVEIAEALEGEMKFWNGDDGLPHRCGNVDIRGDHSEHMARLKSFLEESGLEELESVFLSEEEVKDSDGHSYHLYWES